MKDENEKRILINSGGAIHPVAEKIEDFIEHYYNGDLTLRLEAFKVPFSYNYQKGNLGTFLTTSLANYLAAKGNRDTQQIADASTLALICITQARGANLILESQTVLNKLKITEEENKRLKDNQQKLEEQVLKLKNENQEFHKALNGMGFKTISTGEADDEPHDE